MRIENELFGVNKLIRFNKPGDDDGGRSHLINNVRTFTREENAAAAAETAKTMGPGVHTVSVDRGAKENATVHSTVVNDKDGVTQAVIVTTTKNT